MDFVPGYQYLSSLCKAIGLDPKRTPVSRIVIDVDVKSVPVVYIKAYLNKEDGENVCQLLENSDVQVKVVPHVTVDEKGNVQFKE